MFIGKIRIWINKAEFVILPRLHNILEVEDMGFGHLLLGKEEEVPLGKGNPQSCAELKRAVWTQGTFSYQNLK